jgi:hypothetical protein
MISFRSFLFGLLCFTLLSSKGYAKRPLEVSRVQYDKGCAPWADVCPAYHYCLVDIAYSTYGVCSCNSFHSKITKPPKDNGTELAPPYTKDDCGLIPSISPVSIFYWFFWGLISLRFFIGSLMVAIRVFKKGEAKMKSSYIGLIGFIIHTVGCSLRSFAYVTYRMQIDNTAWIWDNTRSTYSALEANFGFFFRYEILCAWIDLFEKSIKMSKNTSTAMKVLKILTRTLGLLTLTLNLMMHLDAFADKYAKFNQLTVNIQVPFLGGTCLFLAPVLVRMLCKDMRDVTHPNWKAAAAIRRTAIGEILMQIFLPTCNKYFLAKNIWADFGGIHGECMLMIMYYYILSSNSEWLGYLLFAHRKHLQDDDDLGATKISNFFGFTTLGLNGSVTSEIVSRVSGNSSVMCPGEGDEDDEDNKKEVA